APASSAPRSATRTAYSLCEPGRSDPPIPTTFIPAPYDFQCTRGPADVSRVAPTGPTLGCPVITHRCHARRARLPASVVQRRRSTMTNLAAKIPLPVQAAAMRGVFRLPAMLKRLIAGKPVTRDGQTLALD